MKNKNRELIQRALGIIEGISYTIESKQCEALINAVEIIDMALKDEVEG